MKTNARTLLAAFGACALLAGPASAAFYDKTLAITVTGVPSGVTLADFPLLVRLSESAIAGFSYQDFQGTGGSDLRFETADGTGLAYEVDTWNENGESLVWVKVPQLSQGDVITMRFGSASPDANDPTAVWANYVAVYHGNDLTCATGGDYPASPVPETGGYTLSTTRADHLGSAFFNSNTAQGTRFKLGTRDKNPLAALSSVSRFAVSAWVRSTSDTPKVRFFSNKVAYGDDGFEYMGISGTGVILRGNGSSTQVGANTALYRILKNQSWNFVAATIDGTAGRMIVNDQSVSGSVATPGTAGAQGVAFGGYAADNNKYDSLTGYADEIRIYDGVPAADYLQAEYEQVVTAGYVSYGAVQNAATDTPDISAGPAVVRNPNGTYTVTATVSGVAGNVYDLAVQFGATTLWSATWTAAAGADTYALSWTSAGTEAAGTYAATVVATAPSGASARRTTDEIFLIGDVAAAKGADALEEGLVAGSFVLSRPGDATLPLTVAYTVSSDTATAGVSYQAPSGTATFAAGESTVSVPIVPLNDPALAADATLTLAVAAGSGFYGGVGATASLTLVDFPPPAGYNAWVATYDGNASAAANWSLGRAPVAEDNILLGPWSSRNLTWDAAATNEVASWTQTADYNGQVIFPITYEDSDVDAGFHLFTIAGDASVLGGAWVHPVQGPSVKTAGAPEPVERYWMNIEVGGDFTVGAGVNISGQGRGRGFWTDGGHNSRGVHAGYVITATNQMYAAVTDPVLLPFGSILEPVATGKGSARGNNGTDVDVSEGHGGGALRFVVGGTFSNSGRVIANGQSGSQVAGGAGGSIYVRAAAIAGAGTFEANASAPSGSGQQAAASGGRVALVATGANAASATTASANGSRAPDYWQRENQPYWEGAAGTVWLQSGTEKTLLVRNVVESWSNGTRYDLGPYVRAYTPIPADDDTAAFRAAAAGAELYAASNARIRLVRNVRFAALKVRTESGSFAHVDLCGRVLRVDRVVDSGDTVIADRRGAYTLADARSNGWAWLEDTAGGGQLVIGEQATVIVVR